MFLREEARKNQQKTIILMLFFAIPIIGIGYLYDGFNGMIITGIITAIYFMVIFIFGSLSIATMFNAEELSQEEYPEVYQLVEEICITADIPMPKILIKRTPVPNAFASGISEKKSVVGVTTGLIELLDRGELEAVLAHEISHIKNKDILVTFTAIALSAAFVLVVRRYLLSGRVQYKNITKKNGHKLLILSLVIAIFAPLISLVVRMAISRQREYLADTQAVLYTSYKEGMVGALTKLKNYSTSLNKDEIIEEFGGKEMVEFYFMNPISNLFSTHPSLDKRIAKITESY